MIRAHKASGQGAHMRAYKLRDRPAEILPCTMATQSSDNKHTKLENFFDAPDAVSAANGIPIFGGRRIPTSSTC